MTIEDGDGADAAAADRFVAATVRGWSPLELATVLAGFHPDVIVDGPAAVQHELGRIGEAIAATYPSIPG